MLNKIRKAQGKLEQKLQRDATADELEDILEIDKEKFAHLLEANLQTTSLDNHI